MVWLFLELLASTHIAMDSHSSTQDAYHYVSKKELYEKMAIVVGFVCLPLVGLGCRLAVNISLDDHVHATLTNNTTYN